MKIRLLTSICLFIVSASSAQMASTKPKIKDWHLLDFGTHGYRGISLDKAYELLKNRQSTTVVVGVIDSGIDTTQEDLVEVLWTNPGEIKANGLDDDGNGLVDDYYGWNYLGGKNHENLKISVSERYRTYHRFKAEFEHKNEKDIPTDKKFVYEEWKRARKMILEKYEEAAKDIVQLRENYKMVTTTNSVLTRFLKKESFTRHEITNIKSRDSVGLAAVIWKQVFDDKEFTNKDVLKDFENYVKSQEEAIEQKTVYPVAYRDSLLNDNGYDISHTIYGNSNLQTHSGYHGTSVSGIIAAKRGNGKGIDGIADNVRIMMVRGILGDDEFDKDVALSIRYAVDHGAKVINMSFGKPFSPDKKWVDDAIKYAQQKDVVLVHASGNNGWNIDSTGFYPHAFYLDGTRMPHFLNVGASGDYSTGGLAAAFSNYGKKMVDLFAPGMDVHCTVAGPNTQVASGTSLASPVVAGIAALLRSYFPKLTAPQVVDILKKSAIRINEPVALPGNSGQKIPFDQLSETGGLVNAYEAVKLALSLAGK